VQLAIVWCMTGVILGLPASIYTATHTRPKGHPFDSVRRVLLALALLGCVFLIAAMAQYLSVVSTK